MVCKEQDDDDQPGEQVQLCERANPEAAVPVLDAGRNHLATGVPRFGPDEAMVTSTLII